MKLQSIGKTEEGRDQWMAVITSPENMKKLARYKEIAGKLADRKSTRLNSRFSSSATIVSRVNSNSWAFTASGPRTYFCSIESSCICCCNLPHGSPSFRSEEH